MEEERQADMSLISREVKAVSPGHLYRQQRAVADVYKDDTLYISTPIYSIKPKHPKYGH